MVAQTAGVHLPPMAGPRARERKDRPNSVAIYRFRAGLSQEDLAAKIGLTGRSIHRLETKGTGLTIARARQIGQVLGGIAEHDLMREPVSTEVTLRSLGLPVAPLEIAQPVLMAESIIGLIKSGALADAASSCRTLARLLVEIDARRQPVADDQVESGRKGGNDRSKASPARQR
jgi:transcriptional regulator with XRE-family HTH domain